MEKWRNRILSWILAISPFSGLYVAGDTFGSMGFVICLVCYIFLYRPFIDTQRLISLNLIEKKDVWRFFVPLLVDKIRYVRSLWLG